MGWESQVAKKWYRSQICFGKLTHVAEKLVATKIQKLRHVCQNFDSSLGSRKKIGHVSVRSPGRVGGSSIEASHDRPPGDVGGIIKVRHAIDRQEMSAELLKSVTLLSTFHKINMLWATQAYLIQSQAVVKLSCGEHTATIQSRPEAPRRVNSELLGLLG